MCQLVWYVQLFERFDRPQGIEGLRKLRSTIYIINSLLNNSMYKAHITVTLRPAILDPQGKATHQALQSLGFDEINSVRIGKYMELELSATSKEDAELAARTACEKLLANPIMEDFSVKVEPVDAPRSFV